MNLGRSSSGSASVRTSYGRRAARPASRRESLALPLVPQQPLNLNLNFSVQYGSAAVSSREPAFSGCRVVNRMVKSSESPARHPRPSPTSRFKPQSALARRRVARRRSASAACSDRLAAVRPDPNWNKWAEWLGDGPGQVTIYGDLHGLRAARRVWEGFQTIVYVAPDEAKKYGNFHSFLDQSYIRSQGLGVRRQVEVSDDVVSLGRLLDRISKSPSVVTRERYLAELHPRRPDLGNQFFDELVSPGAKALDATTPLAHLEKLRIETVEVREWVNKEVAHYDRDTGKFSERLTFGDVHRGIDLLFETMNYYQQLLRGVTISGSVTMAPWEAVFRVRWIPDDGSWQYVVRTQQETDDRRS